VSRLLIVEADGGSRGNPGEAAYGAVVRDGETGEVLAERAERIGIASNNVAEYRGIIAGLEAAVGIDPTARIEARLDSKLVVEQMSGRWKIKHPDMIALALRAREIVDPAQVTYAWVPRAQNATADRLVNEVLDGGPARTAESAIASTERSKAPAPREPADTRQPQVEGGQVQPPPEVVAKAPIRIVGWATDLGTPTTLLLLRHGETPHTAAKVFSGSGGADPALSPRGQEQAKSAGEALAARGDLDAVITSPLRRCRETAEIVASALGLDVTVDEGFAEADFGEWDGRTLEEVAERWPDVLEAWLTSGDVAPPGGETTNAVVERVAAARERVLTAHAGRTVLVVTHVTPIKTLVRLALGAPPEAIYRMELAPASLSEVQYYENGVAAMRAFSVVTHLGSVELTGL
jgi:probable phosphoglycerate mutase